MLTKAFSTVLIILLLTFQNTFSQEAQINNNNNLFIGHIYARDSGLPIDKATIKTLSKNGIKYFITDTNGKFEIPNTYKNSIDFIEVSSLGFKKIIDKIVSNSIYLEYETNLLDEVIVDTNFKMKNQLSFFEKLNPLESGFSWKNKAIVYIPKSIENKGIKNLLFAVSDIGGVKNLKYLPFKVNLYTVDSLGMPDKTVFDQDIVVKKTDDNDWTKVDISKYKVTIPDEGIFIAFIILDEKDYPTEFIRAKNGWISAVPALKAYRYSKTYIRKSYIYRHCDYPEKCNIWLPQKLHYMMDIEY